MLSLVALASVDNSGSALCDLVAERCEEPSCSHVYDLVVYATKGITMKSAVSSDRAFLSRDDDFVRLHYISLTKNLQLKILFRFGFFFTAIVI